jgi:hypothetical protein
LPATTRASNEPLGALVARTRRAMRRPLRWSVTVQRTPFRFWSTSNSTSMRPFSALSFSFDVLAFVHVPALEDVACRRPWRVLGRRGGHSHM